MLRRLLHRPESRAGQAAGERPWNVLFIMTDQHRWDALGVAGGYVDTPAIDRVAAEGVRFANAVTNAPGCIPARAALATGMYPHNSEVWQNSPFTLDAESPTWMRAIHNAGYATALFGKTHLHPQAGDLRDKVDLLHAWGFETVDEIGGPWANTSVMSNMTEGWQEHGLLQAYRDDLQEREQTKFHLVRPTTLGLEWYYDTYVGQRAAQFLRSNQDPRPWFLWVSFGGPHDPWDAPEPYASRYRPGDMPPPIPRPTDLGDAPPGLLHERLSTPGPWNPGLAADEVPKLRANYAGEVSLIDDQIAQLFKIIQERGEWQRTVVAFTSDHGEMNGDYNLLGKTLFLNGSVRVPLLIRTPQTAQSSAGGRVFAGPVELMDLGVTLAELAGASTADLGWGKSLCPILDGATNWPRTEALSEVRNEYMLLTDTWKIGFRPDLRPYMLFNLHEDPNELSNLAGASRVGTIEKALGELLRDRIALTRRPA
jgi:arylsulfatase